MTDNQPLVNTPCGSCHKCCTGHEMVILMPEYGDDVSHYATEKDQYGNTVLRRQLNGDCIYLDADGCSIHGEQPYVCRSYDCRIGYLKLKSLSPEDRLTVLTATEGWVLHGQGKVMQDQHPISQADMRDFEQAVASAVFGNKVVSHDI